MLMFLGSPGLDRDAVLRHDRRVAAGADAGRFHRAPAAGSRSSSSCCVMWFAPNIATVIDVLDAAGIARSVSAAAALQRRHPDDDIFFVFCSLPIMWFSHTLFLARLLFGRTIDWGGQARDDHAVPWSRRVPAASGRRPCSGFGIARSAGGHACRAPFPMRFLHRRRPCSCRSRSRWSPPAPARRARPDAARARPPAGGDGAAAETCRARWNCRPSNVAAPRSRSAALTGMCRGRFRGPRAAVAALAAHLLRRSRAHAPRMDRLYGAVRPTRAIWCSTSAPMSATASPPSAGSARAWWRSSRSRRSRGR